MEQSPFRGEVGPDDKLKRYADLPHYYQCLGKACAAAGLLGEFYAVVEAGFDYGQVVSMLRRELEDSINAPSLDSWLEHFGIPSGFEEHEVEYLPETE